MKWIWVVRNIICTRIILEVYFNNTQFYQPQLLVPTLNLGQYGTQFFPRKVWNYNEKTCHGRTFIQRNSHSLKYNDRFTCEYLSSHRYLSVTTYASASKFYFLPTLFLVVSSFSRFLVFPSMYLINITSKRDTA